MRQLASFFAKGPARVERHGAGCAGMRRVLVRALAVGALALSSVGVFAQSADVLSAERAYLGPAVAKQVLLQHFEAATKERGDARAYKVERQLSERISSGMHSMASAEMEIQLLTGKLQAFGANIGLPFSPTPQVTCGLTVGLDPELDGDLLKSWFFSSWDGLEFVARHEEDHCQTNAVLFKTAVEVELAARGGVRSGGEVSELLDRAVGDLQGLTAGTVSSAEGLSVFKETHADVSAVLRMASARSGVFDAQGVVVRVRVPVFMEMVRDFSGKVMAGRDERGEFDRAGVVADAGSHDTEGGLRALSLASFDDLMIHSASDIPGVATRLGRLSVTHHFQEKMGSALVNSAFRQEFFKRITRQFHDGTQAVCQLLAPSAPMVKALPSPLELFEPVVPKAGGEGEWLASPCGAGQVVVTNGFSEKVYSEADFLQTFNVPRFDTTAGARSAQRGASVASVLVRQDDAYRGPGL